MIRRLGLFARNLCGNRDGAMAIETAILAPVLITLAIGAFEVSTIVARQTELQSALAEAAAVVRAAVPETVEARTAIRDVMVTSTGLSEDQVTVTQVFRCGTAAAYVANRDLCGESDHVNTYISVAMSDSYEPLWTQFGVGEVMEFDVSRTIQVG